MVITLSPEEVARAVQHYMVQKVGAGTKSDFKVLTKPSAVSVNVQIPKYHG